MSNLLFKTAEAQDRNGSSLGNSLSQIAPQGSFQGDQPLSVVLNQLFYLGLALAVVLALFSVVRGGLQYMAGADAADSKTAAKRRIQAAVGGLVLAFGAVLILNTINPNLTDLRLKLQEIKVVRGGGIGLDGTENTSGGVTSGSRPGQGASVPAGTYGSWNEQTADQAILAMQNGSRKNDGSLNVSVYSSTGDSTPDSNTTERRGNSNNLLREGSVALSPDLIAQYRPTLGSEIFINGQSIGFYEDTTAASYNGVRFSNTIDIYDENGSMGSRNIFKNINGTNWTIEFGEPRPQIRNP